MLIKSLLALTLFLAATAAFAADDCSGNPPSCIKDLRELKIYNDGVAAGVAAALTAKDKTH